MKLAPRATVLKTDTSVLFLRALPLSSTAPHWLSNRWSSGLPQSAPCHCSAASPCDRSARCPGCRWCTRRSRSRDRTAPHWLRHRAAAIAEDARFICFETSAALSCQLSDSTTNMHSPTHLLDNCQRSTSSFGYLSEGWWRAGSGVICETRALQAAVIPAKAGIHSASLRKCAVYGLDSRFRGNDRHFVRVNWML
jgi:hypothetical protein